MSLFKLSFALIFSLFIFHSSAAIRAGYDYTDNIEESKMPPGGLSVSQVPLFVVLGFDDNSRSGTAEGGGIYWVDNMLSGKVNPTQSTANVSTFDGSDVKATFYCNLESFDGWQEDGPPHMKPAIKHIYDQGHEIANHTYSHWRNKTTPTILSQSLDSWKGTITDNDNCAIKPYLSQDFLDTAADWEIDQELESSTYGAGIPLDSIRGFRAPYLAYTDKTMFALKDLGFWYDCSIEDGTEDPTNDGTNFRWPYTLNSASTSANANPGDGTWGHNAIEPTPGLWELPNCPLAVPSNLQSKAGKNLVTGLDYNLFDKTQYGFTDAEVLEILKYNLDQRLDGNRAPFMIGLHSQFYFDSWATAHANVSGAQMRKCIEDFVDYCISKDVVRVVRGIDVIEWCRNPVGLNGTSVNDNYKNVESNMQLNVVNKSIIINNKISSKVSLKLYSFKGQLVGKKSLSGGNKNVWHIDNSVTPGIYLLKIKEGRKELKYKVKIP